jgi:uncharacterized protein (DUF1697 family)
MHARSVSLLRGINVGGHHLLPMTRLRSIYESLGCEDVTSYLQSGNVLFRHRDPAAIAANVETAIKDEFGFAIRVLGRSHAQLAGIVAADPFPGAEPRQRIVLFLSAAPDAANARELGHLTSGRDEAVLIGTEFHLHLAGGVIGSKVPGLLDERRLGVTVTGRNWRTVTRLAELSGPQPGSGA